MLRLSMLLSCIFMSNRALDDANNLMRSSSSSAIAADTNEIDTVGAGAVADFDRYAVTCYICVNVSDNVVCNQYAIDRPCKSGETFCHTLHIMDSKGTSVLVNKKCTTDKECQQNKVGCVEIDTRKICISCCDQNYCNVNAPANASTAIYDDKITRMRAHAKNLFHGVVSGSGAGSLNEKALSTTKFSGAPSITPTTRCLLLLLQSALLILPLILL